MIRDLALLGARLAVGAGMAAHGTQKALGWFEGPGPENAAKMMHGLGFRPGQSYAAAASWNEVVAGSLIALGLGGPVGPAMLITNMIVAQTAVHAPNGFFAAKNGIEVGLLYSAAALALAVTDYGSLSLDAVLGLREKLHDPWFTALVLAGGATSALLVLNARDTSTEGPATRTYQGKNSPLPQEPAPTP